MQELLLRLLDTHRVLSTSQLSRFTSAPQRTSEHRLAQLARRGAVGRIRPSRHAGSAPWHWWLTPAGARLINGTACAADHRAPNPLFLAHTTAIADLLLALSEAGPTAGLAVQGWWSDTAGWVQWPAGSTVGGRPRRITPDATAHLRLTDPSATSSTASDCRPPRQLDPPLPLAAVEGTTSSPSRLPLAGAVGAALFEVDLATMTADKLRQKLHRYLDYAADLAWQPAQPHAPLLLVLTTSEARAGNFLAGAARTMPKPDAVWRPPHEQELDAAQRLHVAACGLVRDPLRAVTEPVWRRPGDPRPVTLRALLEERIGLQARAERVRVQLVESASRAHLHGQLRQITRRPLPAGMLPADPQAAAVLTVLHAEGGDSLPLWADRHPDATQHLLRRWSACLNAGRADTDTSAGCAGAAAVPPMELSDLELAAALAGEHQRRWAEQARALLRATGPIAIASPVWRAAAHRLLTGQLNRAFDLERASTATETPQQAQTRLWRAREHGQLDYPARREQAVARSWQALSLRARRRITLEQLRADFDAAHLRACGGCGLHLADDSINSDGVDSDAHLGGSDGVCPVCLQLAGPAGGAASGELLTVGQQVDALTAGLR